VAGDVVFFLVINWAQAKAGFQASKDGFDLG
jgi:hypothetical protein